MLEPCMIEFEWTRCLLWVGLVYFEYVKILQHATCLRFRLSVLDMCGFETTWTVYLLCSSKTEGKLRTVVKTSSIHIILINLNSSLSGPVIREPGVEPVRRFDTSFTSLLGRSSFAQATPKKKPLGNSLPSWIKHPPNEVRFSSSNKVFLWKRTHRVNREGEKNIDLIKHHHEGPIFLPTKNTREHYSGGFYIPQCRWLSQHLEGNRAAGLRARSGCRHTNV